MKPAHPQASAVNNLLDQLEKQTGDWYHEAVIKGSDTYTYIKERFSGAQPNRISFLEQVQLLIEANEKEKPGMAATEDASELNPYKQRGWGTVKNYKSLLEDIKVYADQTKTRIDYDSFDARFPDLFVGYLSQVKRNYNNTAQKKLEYIKALLNEFRRKGLHTNSEYQNWQRVKNTTSPTEFALSEAEVSRLEKLDLSGNLRLEQVRDTFVFMCRIGLRDSDASGLSKTSVLENNGSIALVFTSVKTKQPVAVPFSRNLLERHNKYDCQFPKMTNQKFNDYLKELARLAGIDEQFRRVTYIGNKRQEEVLLKCDEIASHTARRTFATLAFVQGMNLKHIQEYLVTQPCSKLRSISRAYWAILIRAGLRGWRGWFSLMAKANCVVTE